MTEREKKVRKIVPFFSQLCMENTRQDHTNRGTSIHRSEVLKKKVGAAYMGTAKQDVSSIVCHRVGTRISGNKCLSQPERSCGLVVLLS